jgi:hypothetical protein
LSPFAELSARLDKLIQSSRFLNRGGVSDFIYPPFFTAVYQWLVFIAKSGTANVAVPPLL